MNEENKETCRYLLKKFPELADGVEWKTLGEVCEIYDGTHQTPDYQSSGIKFASVENIQNPYSTKKFISEEDFSKYKIKPKINDVLMTRIGSIGVCYVIDKNEPLAYYVSLALIRPDNKIINSRFLKYAIESSDGKAELAKRTLVHAVPIKVNKNEIGKILIPLPPLPVQQEIVRILDKFTELISLLERELVLRKKQYEYYRDKLISEAKGAEWKTLGEVAEIGTGSSNTDDAIGNGRYPFFVRSQNVLRKDDYEYDETAIITAGDGVGVGKVFHYVEGKYALHQRAYRIHIINEKLMPKYFFHYMKASFFNYISKEQFKASVQSIRRPMLNNFPVPLPPLPEQERIVQILDKFESLVNSLTSGIPAEIKLRKKQYEYYRDLLLTFKRK